MVLQKERETLKDVETNCETECNNLNKIWSDLKMIWPSQEFGGELTLLMPHVSVGNKKIKKQKI